MSLERKTRPNRTYTHARHVHDGCGGAVQASMRTTRSLFAVPPKIFARTQGHPQPGAMSIRPVVTRKETQFLAPLNVFIDRPSRGGCCNQCPSPPCDRDTLFCPSSEYPDVRPTFVVQATDPGDQPQGPRSETCGRLPREQINGVENDVPEGRVAVVRLRLDDGSPSPPHRSTLSAGWNVQNRVFRRCRAACPQV